MRVKFLHLLIGVSVGFLLSLILRQFFNQCRPAAQSEAEYIVNIPEVEVLDNELENDKDPVHLTARGYQLGDKVNPNTEKLVVIGVMTAEKYLSTRATAVYRTWAQNVPGKVIFFTGENVNRSLKTDIPLVTLPGVNDSYYPPQRKSFMMLKYMHDHYGEEYEWFMRADDDLYVRTDKLGVFLRSLNSNLLYFIGQAGRGNREELGTLNLAYDENFCMGGPGIIFSRATIRKFAPHVSECLANMSTGHEDVEVGRCVRRFANLPCTWAYEMQTMFYHNSSGDAAFTQRLNYREVHKAITLHPIKNHNQFYRIHSYFQGREIDRLLYESVQLQRDLLYIASNSQRGLDLTNYLQGEKDLVTRYDSYNVTGLNVSLRKFIPSQKSEIQQWSFLSKTSYNIPNRRNPKQKPDIAARDELKDVIRDLMDIINGPSKDRGRIIDFKELLYGYHRVNPRSGVDYILDLLLIYKKYKGKKITTPVRRHAYVQRPFAPLQLRVLPDITEYFLAFVVPLSGRFSTFERFFQNFLFVCNSFSKEIWKSSLHLKLIVVYFGTDTEYEKFLSLLNSLQENQPKSLCTVKVLHEDKEFSRGLGLATGISHCGDNDLLFLVDVDIVFSPDAVRRILLNTVQGEQVYFPIVFSEYSNDLFPDKLQTAESFTISTDTGYWREFGYGIASFFKSDFRSVGGFDLNIRGWGLEDVSLFDKFVKTNLTVFRSPDPELLHLYHPVKCDPGLPRPQYDMCLGSQASTLGSMNNLINFMLTNRHLDKKLEEFSSLLFRA